MKAIRVQWSKWLLSFSSRLFFMVFLSTLPTPSYLQPDIQKENTSFNIAIQSSKTLQIALQPYATTALDEHNLTRSIFPVVRNGEVELINIAQEICSNHSEDFGFALLGSRRCSIVTEITRNHRNTANKRIILEWLKWKGRRPVTCEVLIDALHEIGYDKLANEVAATCEALKIIALPFKPILVMEYSQKLLQKYQKEPIMNVTQWLPRMFNRQNITLEFVDLELKENGDNLLLQNLINSIQYGTRILFLGRPGVGKTTILRHLSKILISNNKPSNFDLIIKIHLGSSGKIDKLSTLLLNQVSHDKSFDSNDFDELAEYLSITLGRGVCVLLDGFDEYVYDSSDYVSSIIRGDSLTEAVVMLTSRPSAAEIIRPLFHGQREIEIIGFGDNGIKMYLDQLNIPQDKNQTIYEYFDTHPNVKQMCYLPLHLSMLVYIATVTTDSNTLSLVDTETELYSDFLTQTIAQYKTVRHEQMAKSFMECFDNNYKDTDPCYILWPITENAFKGVVNRELVFNSSSFDDLPNSTDILSRIDSLSLFKVDKDYDRHGYEILIYHYSHPTFQEFLAAFYLTTLPRTEQLRYVKHYWMQETYKFFLGLIGRKLKKKYDENTVYQLFINYSREVLATRQEQEIYVMKCAHEAGRHDFHFVDYLKAVDVISDNNSVTVPVGYDHYGCWYIGFLLAQSSLSELHVNKFSGLASCLTFISNYLKHSPSLGANVAKLALGDESHGYWAWFTEREDLDDTSEVLDFLLTFQNNYLTELQLQFFRFEHGSSVLHLGKTLRLFQHLELLALSVNISVIKEGHLVAALKNLTTLETLELGVISKHDDETPIPDNLLEFEELKQLKRFTLYTSWNKDIVDVNATALIGGLESLTNLEHFTLDITLYSGFRVNGVTELLHGIERLTFSELTLKLVLCWFGMGNITTNELAAVLKKLTKLRNLFLCIDFNRFGDIQGQSVPTELIEGLKGLIELQELHLELSWELQENDDINETCTAFAKGLSTLHNLKILKLNFMQNGDFSGIKPLFKSLNQLLELKLEWNNPGDKTIVAELFNGLICLKKLRKLDLSSNAIGDNDMISLTETLKSINQLSVLDLSRNEIGDDGIQLLASLIDSQYLSHLQALYLSFNNMSRVGAEILSQKAAKLPSLRILDLGLDLGSYSAQALIMLHPQTQSYDPSKKSFYNAIVDLLPLVAVFVAVLVGGILCYLALKQIPEVKGTASYGTHKAKAISKSLAQGLFSTSSAWNLEALRKKYPSLDGSGTVIAIFDTAIDLDLPAFQQKSLKNQITIVNCLQELPISSVEHGSVCASVAVGLSYTYDPTTVIPSGVAPGAHLILYRIAENESSYIQSVLSALNDMKAKINSGIQIDVVSISYDLGDEKVDLVQKEINTLARKGVVFVAAAGNRGHYQAHASIPARFDNVISVGALDKNGLRSPFTSVGRVDVFAPGENIPSPLSPSGVFNGTSFATPAVSGLVLLLKQCVKVVGPPASLYIHEAGILRSIFQKYMIIRSDNGLVDVFDPVGFFVRVMEDPNLLNCIVGDHLPQRMEH